MMNKIFLKGLIVSVFLTALISCGKKKADQGAAPERIHVSVVLAEKGMVREFVETPGILEAVQNATCASELAGTIRKIRVREGSEVKKGEVLLELDREVEENQVKEAKAKLESSKAVLQEAKENLEKAKREFRRTKDLYHRGMMTEQNWEDAQTEKNLAKARLLEATSAFHAAQVGLAQSKTRLARRFFKAPFLGTIMKKEVQVGEYVTPGKPLFRLVNLSQLEGKFHVSEKYASFLKQGSPVMMTASGGDSILGTLRFVSREVSASGTLDVIVSVKNRKRRYVSGKFVRARIRGEEKQSVLRVPISSVFFPKDASAYVWAVRNGKAERVSFLSGLPGEKYVEVRGESLKEGERIVVRGGSELKDGEAVSYDK